eukprot:TRINITY_DN1896_c0_g1_i7.p1 TRINITY_DN1896_c0_g1~~TRINITY_DN1896_c0_g1_i7.p1  ORF type:complete len:199 (+),score=44.30 TRINITY_DN1896_c0_g1_i7:1495-2091(+)
MVSSMGMFNVTLPVVARAFACLGDMGMFPPTVSILHRTWATPYISILIIAGSCIVCLMLPDFEILVQLDVFTSLFSLILEFSAFVFLRYSEPEMERPYKVPGGNKAAILLAAFPITLCIILIAISSGFTIMIGCAAIFGAALLFPVFHFVIMPRYHTPSSSLFPTDHTDIHVIDTLDDRLPLIFHHDEEQSEDDIKTE